MSLYRAAVSAYVFIDLLTALSVASSVVQFVDFGIKILDTGTEIYHSTSGTSVQNAVIEDITRDLQGLLVRLRAQPKALPSGPPIPEQPSTEKLAKGCEETGIELLARLERLNINGNAGKWKSLRAALLSIWSEKDIQEIAKDWRSIRGN